MLFGPFASEPSSGRPDLRDDVRHFGVAEQRGANAALDVLAGVDRRGGRQADGEPDVAFIELRQELGAELRREQQRDDDQRTRGRDDEHRPAHA